MSDQATVQAVLNRPDEAMPPPNGPSVPEHALSLTGALSTVDSTALPPIDESMVSEKFITLKDETKTVTTKLDFAPKPSKVATQNGSRQAPSTPPPKTVLPNISSPAVSSPPRTPLGDVSTVTADLVSEIQPAEPAMPAVALRPIHQPSTPTKAQQAPTPAPPIITPRPSETRIEGNKAAWAAERKVEADLARERDVAAAFAGLPRVKPCWTHYYMKILLVGDDGLGKTTFVRNLFAAYASDVDFPGADASAVGAGRVFGDHPEQLCTELAVQDEDSMVWWHYLVQVR